MKITIVRALTIGGIVAAWLFGSFSALGFLTSISLRSLRSLTGVFGLVILFGGIFYGIQKAKRESPDKTISYWECVKIGVTISLVSAIIVSLSSILYLKVFNPGFANDMVRDAEHSLVLSGRDRVEVARELEKVRNSFSLINQVLVSLIGQSCLGTIFTMVLSLFQKTKNK